MSSERYGGLRASIAVEAARLMYEEEVKQYFTAKRMAAKRLLGRVGGRRLRYRPSDLPSNGEIRDALLALADAVEGDGRTRRLFAMRVVALETMRALAPFEPRLIGSVSTGHVRKGSDIDLHVFTDEPDTLFAHLHGLRWAFETERVTIFKYGELREYLHAHVADVYAIELTIYDRGDLRFRPRSSTDGKPIVRWKTAALEDLIAEEHSGPWARYLRDGTITGIKDGAEDGVDVERDTAEDGDLPTVGLDDDIDPEDLPRSDELDDPDELYDALPGFESFSDGDVTSDTTMTP